LIKSIRLKNWKSYDDSVLYIDPLTILIGMNASGKSNVIDALIFINRIAGGSGIFEAISGDASLNALRGGIDWVCKKNANAFTIELVIEYEEIEYEYSITVEVAAVKALVKEEKLYQKNGTNEGIRLFSTTLRDSVLLNIPTYYSTGKQGKEQNFELSRTVSILYQTKTLHLKKREITVIADHLLSLMRGIFVLNPIPDHMRGYSPLAERLMTDGSNIAGVLAALNAAKKKEILTKLTSYLRNIPEKDIVSVWTEYVGKFNTDAMLYCKEGWKKDDDCIVDARGMSDGTLRFLAIVTAMLINERNKLIVVEEADNGLHPSRVDNLLNMLRELGIERNIDVIITTHNPALLNAAGTSMIPFITVAHRNQSGQSELTLLEDIEKLPKLLSAGNIGELAAGGKIESALSRRKENEQSSDH